MPGGPVHARLPEDQVTLDFSAFVTDVGCKNKIEEISCSEATKKAGRQALLGNVP